LSLDQDHNASQWGGLDTNLVLPSSFHWVTLSAPLEWGLLWAQNMEKSRILTMSGTAHPPDTGFYQCSCFRENQLPLAGKGTRKTIRKDCRSISSYKAHGQSDEGTGRGLVITHKGR
jgi:hypothetical protein